ncbi:MAG: c-type cytochrome [Bacteroidia bacterium]|nr:c-type cytochrome [Bacteroidia bacterium]
MILGLFFFLFKNIPEEKIAATPNNPTWNDYNPNGKPKTEEKKSEYWIAPDTNSISEEKNKELITYGRELIKNTSLYLGPNGSVAHISNGMNCQNCHLEAGTKSFGNNYSAVYSTYPKFRERSGSVENIYKRVNDCFERSLNGNALDTSGKEMQAIYAYIKWLGKDVKKKDKPKGSGIFDLALIDRAANVTKGKTVFTQRCESCHGKNGEGKMNTDNKSYQYPPLWGEHSYNIGAGLYRLTRFAGFVKANMPQGATFENPQLTDEQAWDVAAFVNSQSRPKKDLNKDWPKLSGKPFDNPFGPYADKFSETQHKYGPFGPMKKK